MEMLNYTDLKLTEAATMAANYLSFSFDVYFVSTLLYIALIVFLGTLPGRIISADLASIKKEENYGIIKNFFSPRIRLSLRLLLTVFTLLGVLCFNYSFMSSEYSQNPMERYLYFASNNTRHVLYQFLQSTQSHNSPEEIEKKYRSLTDQLIEEEKLRLSNKTTTENLTEKPTVIVIMNESWWNLDFIPTEQISYSVDPMKPLWDLADRCDLGSVGVNIYGGGTICSESEFLTGLNTKYFSSTSDIEYKDSKQGFPSIAKYFHKLGYDTTAIHPYYGDFYNREERYPVCGFQKTIFEEDMLYQEYFDKYISDESLVNQIIHEYETGSENPDFIFAVSIASHGQMLNYEFNLPDNFPYAIDVTLNNGLNMNQEDYLTFVHYVNGIYESNLAYTKLIDYFEKQTAPVIIVMYGDHCPSFSTETLRTLGFDATTGLDNIPTVPQAEAAQKLYSTPVIAWNNFSDAPFLTEGENITALCDKIIDYTGLPQTRMTLINKYMRTFLKTDTRTYMTDAEGKLITELSKEQASIIETLLMIEDDIINGEQICHDIWDPIEPE